MPHASGVSSGQDKASKPGGVQFGHRTKDAATRRSTVGVKEILSGVFFWGGGLWNVMSYDAELKLKLPVMLPKQELMKTKVKSLNPKP